MTANVDELNTLVVGQHIIQMYRFCMTLSDEP